MRHLYYLLAAATMMGAALGLALLPRLTTDWVIFGLAGAIFSATGAGGWVLAGATAGRWPRPRAGWFLMAGALISALLNLWAYQPGPLLWALLQGAVGTLLIVRLFPGAERAAAHRPGGPVRAPVSRRQPGR